MAPTTPNSRRWVDPSRSDLLEYYRHVGRQIASLPASEHLGELVAMMQIFQAQGVDVAEMMDCLVEAMREG